MTFNWRPENLRPLPFHIDYLIRDLTGNLDWYCLNCGQPWPCDYEKARHL